MGGSRHASLYNNTMQMRRAVYFFKFFFEIKKKLTAELRHVFALVCRNLLAPSSIVTSSQGFLFKNIQQNTMLRLRHSRVLQGFSIFSIIDYATITYGIITSKNVTRTPCGTKKTVFYVIFCKRKKTIRHASLSVILCERGA
jgi:hypothetical protein